MSQTMRCMPFLLAVGLAGCGPKASVGGEETWGGTTTGPETTASGNTTTTTTTTTGSTDGAGTSGDGTSTTGPGCADVQDPCDDAVPCCDGLECSPSGVCDSGSIFLCFAAGTLVATPEGDRPIEALRIGDPVYAYDVEAGKRVVSQVDARFVHPPAPVLTLTLGDRTLHVTGNHPIYQPSTGRYVRADQFVVGDPVLAWQGDETRTRMLEASGVGTPVPVYNIGVAGLHNYFAEGVLVHNKSPDGGSINECDVWAQDCPEGEKCMPWANDGGNSWNATKCAPVDPNPDQPGDTCTVEGNGVSGVDTCDAASMCWGVDAETNEGTCVAFCTGSEASPMCADATTECTIANDGTLILCLPSCDPLLQDCENMDVCIPNPSGGGFVCVVDASGDKGAAGDPCEYVNVCDPGLICGNAESLADCQGAIGCCTPVCDVEDPDASASCPGAPQEECVPWYEVGTAPPGLENVGACLVPM